MESGLITEQDSLEKIRIVIEPCKHLTSEINAIFVILLIHGMDDSQFVRAEFRFLKDTVNSWLRKIELSRHPAL